MAKIQRFMFDEDFDPDAPRRPVKPVAPPKPDPPPKPEPPKPPPPPPPPPAPTFSAEELAAARKKAYQEGFNAGNQVGQQNGKAEADAEATGRLSKAIAKIGDSLAGLLQQVTAERQARTGEPVQIALALVKKLMPTLAERHGLDEIEAAFTNLLAEFVDEPRVTVRVHPHGLKAIEERLRPLAEQRGFAGRLVISGDGKVADTDCRIEWTTGGGERNSQRLLEEIEAAAQKMFAPG